MRVKNSHGFTLIEVLIALAVLAIALAAVMRALAQTIDTTTALRDRMLALWVAQDRLVTHRITRNWPSIDNTEGEAEMGGLKFKYREKVMGTPVSEMRRVEIEVLAFDKPEVLTTLAGYLRQPTTPAARP
jgi:general secretion pathway protein I